jgi:hypothetical protein
MSTIKAVVTLPHVSGLVKDSDQNTFVFADPALTASALATLVNPELVNFYNAPGGTHAICDYISSVIDRAANKVLIEYFDISAHLDGSPAGSPFAVSNFTLGAGVGGVDLPAQCSIVITLFGAGRAAASVLGPAGLVPSSEAAIDQGAPATHMGQTRPKSSHTGRLYIGPLLSTTLAMAAGEMHIDTTCRTDLASSAIVLRGAVTPRWRVWSRRLASTDQVVGGRIDDSVDIQRKRKVAASATTAF